MKNFSSSTDYKIIRELGKGGMANVFLASESRFNLKVAIKVLNREYFHNQTIRKRFFAEAMSMARMNHQNIVKVVDFIDDGDWAAIIMEYVDGESLKELIKRKGRLSDQEIKGFLLQILEALDYVHENKLVHRDIKPSNFMIDGKGKVKLMDFGIAKNLDENSAEHTLTGTGMLLGTPMYMSPEQIAETKSVAPQSDIYSLGVVLWQMVTGQKPYDTNFLTTVQLWRKIELDPLELTSTHWDRIILRATEKDPTKRFNTCREWILNIIELEDFPESGDEMPTIEGDELEDETIVDEPNPLKECFVDDLGIEFIYVKGGNFTMGSNRGLENEKPAHEVTVNQFYMSKYPITQDQWQKLMNGNPSRFKKNGIDCPVEMVSWHECQNFIGNINRRLKSSYRLPTEAEWEFAAKGGCLSIGNIYSGSNDIDEVSWFEKSRIQNEELNLFSKFKILIRKKHLGTHSVGKKKANELGIHDMSGNVWEWCSDIYGSYQSSNQTNPKGPTKGKERVIKGGCWESSPKSCHSAARFGTNPKNKFRSVGFRLVAEIEK